MRPEVHPWKSTAGDLAESPPSASKPAFAWLASAPIIIGLVGLYLLGHFALRLTLSPTLGIDDAEQILFAQQWAFGYRFRQPPLFTWMLMPVIELIGPSVLAISLVRYALLAVTYLFIYLTARLCLHDQRMAGLVVLSFASIYVFAYYAHHDLTHTTALSAMIAISLYVMARLATNPSWTAYLTAGLMFGLGVLAKWNFVMLVAGLALTCAVLPSYRHLVFTRKVLATIVVMAVTLTPTALWMFAQDQSIMIVSSDILAGDLPPGSAATGQVGLWIEGTGALLRSALLFPLPFLPLFLLVFGGSLRAEPETGSSSPKPGLTPAFFGSLILITLLLHLPLIPIFDAVNFTERWLHPALMCLPIFLFALAERGRPGRRRIVAFLAITAILVAAAAGARLYRYSVGVDNCGKCREFAPFAELADGLRSAGFSLGTIVADGMHIGGNLKMLFDESRVIDPAFPRALWPDAADRDGPGSCLLVWRGDDDRSQTRRDLMRSYAQNELGLDERPPSESGELDAFLIGSSSRRYILAFELYREDLGGCR